MLRVDEIVVTMPEKILLMVVGTLPNALDTVELIPENILALS